MRDSETVEKDVGVVCDGGGGTGEVGEARAAPGAVGDRTEGRGGDGDGGTRTADLSKLRGLAIGFAH